MSSKEYEWSKEYYGISHLGKFDLKKTWVTVERYSKSAKLLIWFPGCGFSPTEKWFDSVELAKREGERIMDKMSY